MLTLARIFSGAGTEHLTDSQKRARESEQELNFRWIASFASICTEPLKDAFTDAAQYQFISQIGQYSEIAHGSIPTRFVFEHLEALSRPRFPLDGYDALINDKPVLVDDFEGTVTQLQGYVAFRPNVNQLVAAISGTSQPEQAIRNVSCWMVPYPEGDGTQKVHCGFWDMYQGLRGKAIEALKSGFKRHGDRISEIVVTGHSLGGSLSYLLMMDIITGIKDIMEGIKGSDDITSQRPLPKLRLVIFGAPRVGNEALSEYWTQLLTDYRGNNDDMFQEYSLRINEDGAPTLPPHWLGYRHLTQSPLYLFKGKLYWIPPCHNEYGSFLVEHSEGMTDAVTPASKTDVIGANLHLFSWPLGGHNYYFRDMESLQRRIRWLGLSSEEKGWEQRYQAKLEEWEKKHGLLPLIRS